MATIELSHVSATYDGVEPALDDVDLEVADGELVSVVGPSGCGKSTLLRVIAGLETPSAGSVRIAGESMDGVGARHRDVALMFQTYALYPNMTVAENVGFPLRVAGERSRTIRERVDATIRMLGLRRHADKRPHQLSGGEQQRVALGRAIVRRPRALLMDEPLSNLDAALRSDMRAAIHRLHVDLGMTTVFVTHDQVEAMAMADRVALMRRGRVIQCGAPLELHAAPDDVFAATFIGQPAASIVAVQVAIEDGDVVATLGRQRIPLGPEMLDRIPALRERHGTSVGLGLRADAMRLDPDGPLTVDVQRVEALGHTSIVHAMVRGLDVVPTDEGVAVTDDGLAHLRFTVDPDTTLAPWRPVRVTVDPAHVLLFDLATGRSLARR